MSLCSRSVAGAASRRYFDRHLARHAPTELIPASRIAQTELAPLNRPAPLPASRCCGVLRTAAVRPACSRRSADSSLEARSTCRDRCRLRKRHTSRRWKSGAARIPRRVPPVRSSSREAGRTFLAAWHMPLRVSSYALRRRQGSDAEADFRRVAPAAASRQAERASTNTTRMTEAQPR